MNTEDLQVICAEDICPGDIVYQHKGKIYLVTSTDAKNCAEGYMSLTFFSSGKMSSMVWRRTGWHYVIR